MTDYLDSPSEGTSSAACPSDTNFPRQEDGTRPNLYVRRDRTAAHRTITVCESSRSVKSSPSTLTMWSANSEVERSGKAAFRWFGPEENQPNVNEDNFFGC